MKRGTRVRHNLALNKYNVAYSNNLAATSLLRCWILNEERGIRCLMNVASEEQSKERLSGKARFSVTIAVEMASESYLHGQVE